MQTASGLGDHTERAMKPTITWIVIADGDQAKIFANEGPGKGLHTVDGLKFEQERLRASDIMADRAGRTSIPSKPGGRAAVQFRTDPVELRERRFLIKLADVLEAKRGEGCFHRLIIAAAPTAMGELRPALSEAVRSAIVGEVSRDLTKTPTAQLGSHLDGLLLV